MPDQKKEKKITHRVIGCIKRDSHQYWNIWGMVSSVWYVVSVRYRWDIQIETEDSIQLPMKVDQLFTYICLLHMTLQPYEVDAIIILILQMKKLR